MLRRRPRVPAVPCDASSFPLQHQVDLLEALDVRPQAIGLGLPRRQLLTRARQVAAAAGPLLVHLRPPFARPPSAGGFRLRAAACFRPSTWPPHRAAGRPPRAASSAPPGP